MSDPNSKPSHLTQEKAKKAHQYMLFVEGEQMPAAMHATYKSAYREANRLFGLHPDRRIMVLRHLQTFKRRDPKA